uniref:Major facilitator superfamily (MFS) profile domain-containing protein n=1 Tax=Kwoniella dejecticola CBS 10117 TaxID=1296121 RepID=A0A1A6A742_9TREE|nr:uncharacterized protein I303_03590 [Kwoniella dejecticola CBS 10117]OBR85876.1 hypothetical protein I303_03590 [Kwoniella dejecticola CBS 10117]
MPQAKVQHPQHSASASTIVTNSDRPSSPGVSSLRSHASRTTGSDDISTPIEQFEINEEGTEADADADVSGVRRSNGHGLPPVDGGWGAWTYLAAATALEMLIWGFANSYGVFLDHYDTIYPKSSMLPIIGTVAMRIPAMWVGVVFLGAGLLGAAFAESAGGLVVTQGVLYGIGGTLLWCPPTNYMFEWFHSKRGLAAGIMLSGTGAGGLFMPLISIGLLERFGKRTTLLAIGIGYIILLTLIIPFVRPRLPLSQQTTTRIPKVNWDFLKHAPFWMLWLGVLFQGLAAFMPSTYLPSYATALSLSPTIGTIAIALMNTARVPGQVFLGYLADKLGARKLIISMALASGISVFAGWGAAKDSGGLIGFSIAFGIFAGSYTALLSSFTKVLNHDDPHLPAILYALFYLARGIGSIISGPISAALMNHTTLGNAKGGYGVQGFGVLILWTGAGMIMSGIGAGYKTFKMD